MRKRPYQRCFAAAAAAVLLTVLACAGCASPLPPRAEAVLETLREALPDLPAGQVYLRAVDPGDRAYLSDDLLSALLGPAARGLFDAPADTSADASPPAAPIADAAIYLSETTAPGELAVLVCPDVDSALSAAALYSQHFTALSVAFPGTEYAVRVDGCVVTAAFCRDAEECVRRSRTR